MTNIQNFIRGMIGTPPPGYEVFEYFLGGLIMMSCLYMLFNLFSEMGRFFGAR